MSGVAKSQQKSRLSCIDEVRAGKKLGVWMMVAIAAVSLVLTLPFVKWIHVVNSDALYQALKVSESNLAMLKGSYSVFNVLSFVQYANAGMIGLFAMILLVLMVVAIYFQVALIIKVLANIKSKKGDLGLYGAAEASTLFNIIGAIASIAFVIFSNSKFGMKGFSLSPIAYVVLISIPDLLRYMILTLLREPQYLTL